MAGGLSFVQKATLVYTLLFVFHEWEENRYPGGFIDKVVGKITGLHADESQARASRIPTGILLLTFSLVPFFLDQHLLFFLVASDLCLFEGIIHIVGIRLAKMETPYTPGMVTAEAEAVAAAAVYLHLAKTGALHPGLVAAGVLLFVVCFICMQRSLLAMMGKGYGDIIRNIRARQKAAD